ncbi:MAG: hypothetical protein ACK532_08440 [Acidobacteriota bacterium]
MSGPFRQGYYNSLASLHGWADGDPFYVNYVGHPMQGAVSGFIWAQNDGAYRKLEFGNNSAYWRSRARATAFSFLYSTQFEIGPLSEASLGKIQSRYPQQGFVDHVATPVIGLAWQVAEDWVDRFVIRRFEDRVKNPWARLMMRGWLNPSRSFANLMRWKEPWHRDSRPGILSYARSLELERPRPDPESYPALPRFEFQTTQQYYRSWGQNRSLHCVGGGATAQWNVTSGRSWLVDVGGCKILNQKPNFSGDIMLYQAGMRLAGRAGRWQPFVQFLAGGKRVTLDEVFPEKRAALEAQLSPRPLGYEFHSQWTRMHQANGFTLTVGGGIDLALTRAATWRIASMDLSHAWLPQPEIASYSTSARFSMGMNIRFGNW